MFQVETTIRTADNSHNPPFMSPEQIPLFLMWHLHLHHGGINYELHGQPSCVQTHSCPTEKLQQHT